MDVRDIVHRISTGELSEEEAVRLLDQGSFSEMDYAKIDTSRKARTGFQEVIYCEGKEDRFLLGIVRKMLETWEEMPPYFVTSSEKARGRDEVLDYIDQINKSL